MPFARPSLTGLRNLAVQDITTSGIPGLTGLLRNSVLRTLSWCMAGLAYLVYGYADWIARMGVPFTAEDEFLYAWAALVGIYPKPATAASGQATFTGNVQTPAPIIPSGTALVRQDGTPYVTTADGAVDRSGNVLVPMTATENGAYTNCDPGTVISIARPISFINSGEVTVGPTTGGADDETNAALRSRMPRALRRAAAGWIDRGLSGVGPRSSELHTRLVRPQRHGHRNRGRLCDDGRQRHRRLSARGERRLAI